MEILRTWVLRGANRWARVPVLEVELDLGGERAQPLKLADLTLAIQREGGCEVAFRQVVPMSGAGRFRVLIEFEEEEVGLAALQLAMEQWSASERGEAFDLAGRLPGFRERAYDVRLGPSTRAIVRAAQARGIPFRRLGSGSLVVLGQGAKQRRACTAETGNTSAIAETIAQDKELTRVLLRSVGVPVPQGRPVQDAEDAWRAAEELGLPVVVKPQYGNHGRGVATNLKTREQVERAYAAACEESHAIMVEQHIEGDDYRLLVIGGKLVAAALREPAHVIGNSRATIRQLIDEVNKDPRRSDGHSTSLSYIKIDPVSLGVLEEQGYTPESVPPKDQRVLIRRNGNLSTGGTATDVTDRVHPEVAARAEEAARVVGLDIAGVDLVARDVGLTMEEQRAAVVEVNAGPGLRMHLEPSAGKARPVGEAIVDLLFPLGETGRIPVIAVTGVNGKTTTTRLLAHLFKQAGHVVGMTCTDGLYVDGRRIETRDCSGPRSARAVLLNPSVTAAVLETARGGIVREGLGFDHCDVAVVTNLGEGDHLGLRGVETLEDLARVKGVVVEAVLPSGTAVLNADDPLVRECAATCPGEVVYFSQRSEIPLPAGRQVRLRDGLVQLRDRAVETALLALAEIPLTHDGKIAFQVENVLAAVAAAWAAALPLDAIRQGLRSFSGDNTQCPGRFNVFHVGGAVVIVDYAHNVSALSALVAALDKLPQTRRTFVGTGWNRPDDEVIAMGTIIGNSFDRAIVYRDIENRDRADGELMTLLSRGLGQGKRLNWLSDEKDERTAFQAALACTVPGELVVLGVEAIDDILPWLTARLN